MRSPLEAGRRVAVIGGGDTAVDCARTAIRLGAEEATIVYRRTEAEMPGNAPERGVSVQEGVKIAATWKRRWSSSATTTATCAR